MRPIKVIKIWKRSNYVKTRKISKVDSCFEVIWGQKFSRSIILKNLNFENFQDQSWMILNQSIFSFANRKISQFWKFVKQYYKIVFEIFSQHFGLSMRFKYNHFYKRARPGQKFVKYFSILSSFSWFFRTFVGFRSRWTIFSLCRYSRPFKICFVIWAHSASGTSELDSIKSHKSPPLIRSKTMSQLKNFLYKIKARWLVERNLKLKKMH